ncbi:tetratricopeptide repeat 25 [Pelobates cultripes]|uniref:Tetratricopeptide repeat 25 n=1 Tax=Pelobates cultripes TaxID=61616 RepID=A0AAD1SKC3_PELCU|nr:tetratricopeptide repeat 25 [Pelobates cultripes]
MLEDSNDDDNDMSIHRWEEKIPLANSSLEKTWLFHEIGRCYLALEAPVEARDYGEKSQVAAEEAEDTEWQLNASVLVAQAQVKLEEYESAVTNFENALQNAKLLNNKDAEIAIINALGDTKRIVNKINSDHDEKKTDKTLEENTGGEPETREETSSKDDV